MSIRTYYQRCISKLLFNYFRKIRKDSDFFLKNKVEIIQYFESFITNYLTIDSGKIEFCKDEVDKIDFQKYFDIREEDKSDKILNKIRNSIKEVYNSSQFDNKIAIEFLFMDNPEQVYYYLLELDFKIARKYFLKKYYILENFLTYHIQIENIDEKLDKICDEIRNRNNPEKK